MKKVILSIACILTVTAAQSATVNWGATQDTGFADASGIALAQGNLIRLGYFTITDAAVSAGKASPSTLDLSWHAIVDTTVGTGTGAAATFSLISTPTLSGADFGHQIYIWVLNASTVGAATQQAIFYEPSVSNPSWSFPGSNLSSTTIDIAQAKTSLGGTYLAGVYEASNASVASIMGAGAGAVRLETVPEPSTIAFCTLAAMAAAGSRRRRRN